tara:strand:- start:6368 stop:7135 length:768 start_codon:yes stop_codon:yes gene_type:complete
LHNPDNVAIAGLNPVEDYKTSVLRELCPAIIMEFVSCGLAVHGYRTSQEILYQEHLAKGLTENYVHHKVHFIYADLALACRTRQTHGGRPDVETENKSIAWPSLLCFSDAMLAWKKYGQQRVIVASVTLTSIAGERIVGSETRVTASVEMRGYQDFGWPSKWSGLAGAGPTTEARTVGQLVGSSSLFWVYHWSLCAFDLDARIVRAQCELRLPLPHLLWLERFRHEFPWNGYTVVEVFCAGSMVRLALLFVHTHQ